MILSCCCCCCCFFCWCYDSIDFFPIENRVLAAGNDEAEDCAVEQRREEKEVEVTGACMVAARSIFCFDVLFV